MHCEPCSGCCKYTFSTTRSDYAYTSSISNCIDVNNHTIVRIVEYLESRSATTITGTIYTYSTCTVSVNAISASARISIHAKTGGSNAIYAPATSCLLTPNTNSQTTGTVIRTSYCSRKTTRTSR